MTAWRMEKDPYIKGRLREIEADYTKSRHRWFRPYWKEKEGLWAAKMPEAELKRIKQALKKCYDL